MGPSFFLLYNSVLFYILENKPIGYTDDSTLTAVVPSAGVRVTASESWKRDLDKISEWCDRFLVKLYVSKTKTMIVSSSRTMYPQPKILTISGTVLKESVELDNIVSDI